MTNRSPSWRSIPGSASLLVTLAVLVGLAAGIAGYTPCMPRACRTSSSDPKVCANCHIMNSQYSSWQKSSHHAAAGCVDCHLPRDFFGKWTAKALNGYHHSKAFTLQDFAEPIAIKPGNSRILQANCVACHRDLVHEAATETGREASSVASTAISPWATANAPAWADRIPQPETA